MFVNLQSILERQREYSLYKEYAEAVADLLEKSRYFAGTDKGNHLKQCGTRLFFKGRELVAANFCRERVCPMCQYRRSMKLFAEMLRCAEAMEKDGYRFLHLVLTVPNCESEKLAETVDKLYLSFRKFWGYKRVKKAFKGALRALEVSFNAEMRTFHPHLHVLVAVRKSYFNDTKYYLKHDYLRALWAQACGSEQLFQVSVQAVKAGDWQGVAEVTKYCVKPFDYTTDSSAGLAILEALGYTLKGRRFLQKYGVLAEYYKRAVADVPDKVQELNGENAIEQMFDFALIWNGEHYEIRRETNQV